MSYRVVALGIGNSGKSSLLSALGRRRELFATGDAPGTTRKVSEKSAGDLVLVDTPGLDVSPRHTEAASVAHRTADTVLWCHSLSAGELRPTEVEALARYPRSLLARTCLVLTRADELGPRWQGILEELTTRIAWQLERELSLRFVKPERTPGRAPGGRRPFDIVGTGLFWLGEEAGGPRRERLHGLSGIPRMRRFLDKLAARKAQRTAESAGRVKTSTESGSPAASRG